MKKKKNPGEPANEIDTRLKLFADCCKHYGPEAERQLRMTFDKWDRLLGQCKNEEERKHIKLLAITDVYRMMGYKDGLAVGGKVIIDEDN